MTFKVDGAGVRLYNGNIYLSMDGGGKILLDPAHGILLGTKDLFAFDENDQVTVDKTKANMWLDMEGVIHLEGVQATNGDFTGKLTSCEIYIGGNGTPENCKFGVDKAGNFIGLETFDGKVKIDKDGKAYFKNDVEISGDLTLSGNINMSGGKITWGSNIPNKQRFAASTSGPWHDTMQSGDIYCCDWNYTSGTWGAAYKKVGTDGAAGTNGSDANVPSYVQLKGLDFTDIGASYIKSPEIWGGVIRGADIYGGNYFDLNGIGRLNLSDKDGRYSDMRFRNAQGNYELFSVVDGIGGASLYLMGRKVLWANDNGDAGLGDDIKVTAVFG